MLGRMQSSFGSLLRQWRVTRRMTQEQLALDAEVSARHLSCLETGRAMPSREMVLVLASALDVPLRERNTLLGSAGFASVYRETDLDAPEMAHVRRAIDFILARHEPYGAVVVDAGWNVLRANPSALRTFDAILPASSVRAELMGNVMKMLLHPEGLGRICVNLDEVTHAVVERARREAMLEGPDGAAARTLAELRATIGLPKEHGRSVAPGAMPLVVPVHLRTEGLELRLFSTLTMIGTPADVTAQELRIESWFPADDATDRWLRGS